MKLSSNPLFDRLSNANTILLVGAGGGFDIFSGLPLYFALRDLGKTVYLANLSFSVLPKEKQYRISAACARVDASVKLTPSYFPEFHLCKWFQEALSEEIGIYALEQTGVIPLRAAYKELEKQLRPDALVLVDGGTDSLMRGDEVGLGTPVEDIASIAAATATDIPTKLLTCIGFGIDTYHGVCHAQFLEAVSELTKKNAFLGVTSVLPQMEEAKRFQEALNYVGEKMPNHQSIVATSIAAGMQGEFGNHHSTERTQNSRLWINPLMPIYWTFELDSVAERILYLDAIQETQTYHEVEHRIGAFRARAEKRDWQEMPV